MEKRENSHPIFRTMCIFCEHKLCNVWTTAVLYEVSLLLYNVIMVPDGTMHSRDLAAIFSQPTTYTP